MSGTFFGISVAQSGLAAQRQAMDVLGYNVAHANDPTYKRQRVVMSEGQVLAQAQDASSINNSAIGTGVQSGGIERIYDSLIENRMRDGNSSSAEWEFKSKTMSQLESTLGEPGDTGLQSDIDQFWNSWQKVATTPESIPLRTSLLEDSSALCQRIQYVYARIGDVTQDLNLATADRVNKINVIAEEIGRLNNEVGALDSGQIPVNDLLNRRDNLVQELSKIASINQHGDGKDNFVISLSGRVLVQGTLVNSLKSTTLPGGTQTVQWADDNQDVVLQGGELKAITELRDTIIPDYMSQLDAMVSTMVTAVNTVHKTGKTLTGADGGDFFTAGSTAGNISLDAGILDQPKLIAASSDATAVGNNDIASKIAALKGTPTVSGLTINQMYQNLVGDIGSTASISERQASAHRLTLDQLTTQQQSTSGVSLDEEMTNMIRFQQAYNAASRILTAADEMLSTLIERTGTVGR